MTRHPRALAPFAACLLLASGLGQRPDAQVRPGEVTLNVLALRADGTPAPGLSADDFEIRVDGQPVPIIRCATNDRPLRVVLLVDVTVSMRMGDLASSVVIQRAVDQWLPYGLERADTARIGTIGKHLYLSDRFTSDRRELLQAGFAARSPAMADRQGPSPIWDAIDAAVAALSKEDGLRAVVVMTDGRATGNRVGSRDVTAHALAADASIHFVAERDTPTMVPQLDGTAVTVAPGLAMRAMADSTGGTYASDRPFPWGDPGPLFAKALTALHGGYLLVFRPAIADGRTHAVEVVAKPPQLSVRARRTLLFPPN